jgi:hypothetical protein
MPALIMGVMSALTVLQMKHSRSMNFNSSGSLMYLRATSPAVQRGSTMRRYSLWQYSQALQVDEV